MSLPRKNLCSVHAEAGEEQLGRACATFPRVVNQVQGAVERSLDLSCPEAARLTLLNPAPDFFQEFHGPVGSIDRRLLQIVLDRDTPARPAYFEEVRSFVITLLQNRFYPVAKRLLLLGHVCTKLQELQDTGTQHLTPQVLEGFQFAIESRLFDEHLHQSSAEPSSQLSLVLELVVGRISLDYTSPRYRALYSEFMQGLQLKANSTIFELGERYAEAYFTYYEPFLESREYILEHYLVSYAYKNLFPFGADSITNQYMLLGSYFAATRALAVGLAGHYRSAFNESHLVRAIQVSARTLEHCTSYPARVIQILASKGIASPAAMSILTQSLTQPAWAQDRFATRQMKATA